MAKKPNSGGNSAPCPTCKKRPKVGNCRGRCAACYRAAYRLVKAGKVTWKQLEEKGLIDPPRRHRSEFCEAVRKRIKSVGI